MQEMIRFMVAMLVLTAGGTAFAQEATTYVRYEFNGNVSYGVLEDETIHELRGDIFTAGQRTGNTCDARSSQVADPRRRHARSSRSGSTTAAIWVRPTRLRIRDSLPSTRRR